MAFHLPGYSAIQGYCVAIKNQHNAIKAAKKLKTPSKSNRLTGPLLSNNGATDGMDPTELKRTHMDVMVSLDHLYTIRRCMSSFDYRTFVTTDVDYKALTCDAPLEFLPLGNEDLLLKDRKRSMMLSIVSFCENVAMFNGLSRLGCVLSREYTGAVEDMRKLRNKVAHTYRAVSCEGDGLSSKTVWKELHRMLDGLIRETEEWEGRFFRTRLVAAGILGLDEATSTPIRKINHHKISARIQSAKLQRAVKEKTKKSAMALSTKRHRATEKMHGYLDKPESCIWDVLRPIRKGLLRAAKKLEAPDEWTPVDVKQQTDSDWAAHDASVCPITDDTRKQGAASTEGDEGYTSDGSESCNGSQW